MRKTLRINTGNEIGKTVEKSLDEYFRRLDGEPPHGIYDMVINHVERALIALREALAAAGAKVTDEASAMEAAGHTPRLVPGALENFKVTYPADFDLAERLLKART